LIILFIETSSFDTLFREAAALFLRANLKDTACKEHTNRAGIPKERNTATNNCVEVSRLPSPSLRLLRNALIDDKQSENSSF